MRRIYASMFFMIIARIILSVDNETTVIAIWVLEHPQPLVSNTYFYSEGLQVTNSWNCRVRRLYAQITLLP